MRPPLTFAVAGVTALAVACAGPPADTPAAPHPATGPAHILPATPIAPRPQTTPDGSAVEHLPPPDTGVRADPAAVAAEAVIARLEKEGLFTLDVDTDLAQPAPDRAHVTVRVLHGTGRGHPTESVYTVKLTAVGHSWAVTALVASS